MNKQEVKEICDILEYDKKIESLGVEAKIYHTVARQAAYVENEIKELESEMYAIEMKLKKLKKYNIAPLQELKKELVHPALKLKKNYYEVLYHFDSDLKNNITGGIRTTMSEETLGIFMDMISNNSVDNDRVILSDVTSFKHMHDSNIPKEPIWFPKNKTL